MKFNKKPYKNDATTSGPGASSMNNSSLFSGAQNQSQLSSNTRMVKALAMQISNMGPFLKHKKSPGKKAGKELK